MTQRQFAELVRNSLNNTGRHGKVTRDQANEIVDTVARALVAALRKEGQVKLDSLGVLSVRGVSEKSGVSKMSGEAKEWTVPAHTTVKFAPQYNLLAAVNEDQQGKKFLDNRGISPYNAESDKEFYQG